jgi:hypothetical protein
MELFGRDIDEVSPRNDRLNFPAVKRGTPFKPKQKRIIGTTFQALEDQKLISLLTNSRPSTYNSLLCGRERHRRKCMES